MDIESVLAKHEARLMAIPGVTGVGIGERDGRAVIVVMVTTTASQLESQIPKSLDGFAVVLEVSGEISAFSAQAF
jgi:hypothetical protein